METRVRRRGCWGCREMRCGIGCRRLGLRTRERKKLDECDRLGAHDNMTQAFHRRLWHLRAVRNDAGFEVEFKGTVRVRYSEPGRSVTFCAEPAFIEQGKFKGRHGWLVAISRPTKWDDGTQLSETERVLIQERSKDA